MNHVLEEYVEQERTPLQLALTFEQGKRAFWREQEEALGMQLDDRCCS
jgi:hypothetical protein